MCVVIFVCLCVCVQEQNKYKYAKIIMRAQIEQNKSKIFEFNEDSYNFLISRIIERERNIDQSNLSNAPFDQCRIGRTGTDQ